MKQCFLCFSGSVRKDIAEPIYNILTNIGLRMWYDYRSMLFGDNKYKKNFEEGIAKSSFSIIILSKDIFFKQCAKEEIDYIMRLHQEGVMEVFPIFYDITYDAIPKLYAEWLDKIIYNSYYDLQCLKGTCFQIGIKLYDKICNEISLLPLKELVYQSSSKSLREIYRLYALCNAEEHTEKIIYLYSLAKHFLIESNIAEIDCELMQSLTYLYCQRNLISDDMRFTIPKIMEYIVRLIMRDPSLMIL